MVELIALIFSAPYLIIIGLFIYTIKFFNQGIPKVLEKREYFGISKGIDRVIVGLSVMFWITLPYDWFNESGHQFTRYVTAALGLVGWYWVVSCIVHGHLKTWYNDFRAKKATK